MFVAKTLFLCMFLQFTNITCYIEVTCEVTTLKSLQNRGERSALEAFSILPSPSIPNKKLCKSQNSQISNTRRPYFFGYVSANFPQIPLLSVFWAVFTGSHFTPVKQYKETLSGTFQNTMEGGEGGGASRISRTFLPNSL